MEAIPAHETGVGAHDDKKRQIFHHASHRFKKTLDRKVKIQEAADRQCQEIENQPVIIRVLVDKADVQENQYNIKYRNQPHRCFLLRLKMRELYENHIEPACQKDGEHDKDKKHHILIFFPVHRNLRQTLVDDVVKGEEEKNRSAGENQLIKAFHNLILPALVFLPAHFFRFFLGLLF